MCSPPLGRNMTLLLDKEESISCSLRRATTHRILSSQEWNWTICPTFHLSGRGEEYVYMYECLIFLMNIKFRYGSFGILSEYTLYSNVKCVWKWLRKLLILIWVLGLCETILGTSQRIHNKYPVSYTHLDVYKRQPF